MDLLLDVDAPTNFSNGEIVTIDLDNNALSDKKTDASTIADSILEKLNSLKISDNTRNDFHHPDCFPGSEKPAETSARSGSAVDTSDDAPNYNDEQTECTAALESDYDIIDGISYVTFTHERQLKEIMKLIERDLSEPYSIYTYRYFIHNWPKLCFIAKDTKIETGPCIGAIVCKLEVYHCNIIRGYIAMLAVDKSYRRRQIGSTLVLKAIETMRCQQCEEVVLETEVTNKSALLLYEKLGFIRYKRLHRYYLNGVDAFRLKLWLR